jgi:hypothetical protein
VTEDEDLRGMFYKSPNNYNSTAKSTFHSLERVENAHSEAAFGVMRYETDKSKFNNEFNMNKNKEQIALYSPPVFSIEE